MENTGKEAAKTRLAYLDNLRCFTIFVVVVSHTEITYSSYGYWPYIEGSLEKLSDIEAIVFGLYEMFTHTWLLGVLFFISAFFSAKALAKREPMKYIRERLFRLGLPLLTYMFIIAPFIYYILLGENSENTLGRRYLDFLTSFRWLRSAGPLWFVEILLVFTGIYVLFRKIWPKRRVWLYTITLKNIVSVILSIGALTFLIRLVLPVGSRILNFSVFDFAPYIVMFIVGVIIGENNRMEPIAEKKNIMGLKLALILGIPLWGIIMMVGGPLRGNYIQGGFHWESLVFALWEASVAVGFSMGIIALFKEYLNADNACTRLVSENSFGIYVFHAPVLISVALSLKYWEVNVFVKFAIVALTAYVATFLFTFLIRKIKMVRIIVK